MWFSRASALRKEPVKDWTTGNDRNPPDSKHKSPVCRRPWQWVSSFGRLVWLWRGIVNHSKTRGFRRSCRLISTSRCLSINARIPVAIRSRQRARTQTVLHSKWLWKMKRVRKNPKITYSIANSTYRWCMTLKPGWMSTLTAIDCWCLDFGKPFHCSWNHSVAVVDYLVYWKGALSLRCLQQNKGWMILSIKLNLRFSIRRVRCLRMMDCCDGWVSKNVFAFAMSVNGSSMSWNTSANSMRHIFMFPKQLTRLLPL